METAKQDFMGFNNIELLTENFTCLTQHPTRSLTGRWENAKLPFQP